MSERRRMTARDLRRWLIYTERLVQECYGHLADETSDEDVYERAMLACRFRALSGPFQTAIRSHWKDTRDQVRATLVGMAIETIPFVSIKTITPCRCPRPMLVPRRGLVHMEPLVPRGVQCYEYPFDWWVIMGVDCLSCHASAIDATRVPETFPFFPDPDGGDS